VPAGDDRVRVCVSISFACTIGASYWYSASASVLSGSCGRTRATPATHVASGAACYRGDRHV
jgi:hypothetical protein